MSAVEGVVRSFQSNFSTEKSHLKEPFVLALSLALLSCVGLLASPAIIKNPLGMPSPLSDLWLWYLLAPDEPSSRMTTNRPTTLRKLMMITRTSSGKEVGKRPRKINEFCHLTPTRRGRRVEARVAEALVPPTRHSTLCCRNVYKNNYFLIECRKRTASTYGVHFLLALNAWRDVFFVLSLVRGVTLQIKRGFAVLFKWRLM